MPLLSRLGAFPLILGIALVGFSSAAFARGRAPERQTGTQPGAALGARLSGMSQEIAEPLGLDPRFGVVIRGVEKNGPIARAGLREGDVILGAGAEKVLSGPRELRRVLGEKPRGTPIVLHVLRNGEPLDITFTTVQHGRQPRGGGPDGGGLQASQSGEAKEVPRIGASVTDAPGGGALVRNVRPVFPSAILQPGDVILSVNDNPIGTAEDMANAAERAPDGTPLILRVRRTGQVRVIGLRLGNEGSS